jgi:hypothetical protein
MTFRIVLPRLLLGLVIVAAVLGLAMHKGRLDAAIIEDATRTLGP